MKVGIGFDNQEDSFASGKIIAKRAVQKGGIKRAEFALAFCSTNVNAGELLKGIHEVIGKDIPVLGGSGIGIITNHLISYENYPAGLVLIEDKGIHWQIAVAEGLDECGRKVGRDLANQLSCEKSNKIFLFYDSIKKPLGNNTPPIMNSSKPLLEGLEEELGKNIPIFGGGTVGDFNFSPTIQFAGNCVKSQCASALLLSGNFEIDFSIMHGCSPKDGIYHTITKIDGAVIHEIDNRPIVEVINEMYGNEEWQKQVPVRRLTIGINHGEKFGSEYSEANYVNRLILGVLPDKMGIIIFEPDLEVGMDIQFMLRDSQKMIESARKNSENLIRKIQEKGRKPVWGFYIDCAGRTAMFSETVIEEAEEVQKIFNRNNIPLFGFYSGVEIAPFLHKNRGLDWTGVLTVFSK